jgi:DNA repair protein RadD
MSLIKPRDYQQHAINGVMDFIINKQGHPVNAMPTGTGKSIVIGGIVHQSSMYFPKIRHLMITHVKELVEQNANKLTQMWGGAPLGICCSGLNSKDTMHPIIYGSIGTIANRIEEIGFRNIVQIDECQSVNPKEETMYFETMKTLYKINPNVRFVGHSATIFRLGQGYVTQDGIFTDVCNDMTNIESFNWFIDNGYLAPLYPASTKIKLNVDNVKIQQGEFNLAQLQKAVDKNEITYAALQEVIAIAGERKSWLCFASGVEHAEHIAEMLNTMGISAAAIHSVKSKCTDEQRSQRIADFKSGKIKCLVNNNVLTTGFDHPCIDLIIMLRPTTSPGLWVQMLGRGTRPCNCGCGKTDCKVLDFAGNTMRLGPINDPIIPKQKKKGVAGEAPAKLCEVCDTYNHTKASICIKCANPFTFKVKITEVASNAPLMADVMPQTAVFNVSRVLYDKYVAKSGNTMIKVTYVCSYRNFYEYINFDSNIGLVKHKANEWWRVRMQGDPPKADETRTATDKVLEVASNLRVPIRIKVWVNKKPTEILGYEYE